MPTYDNKEELDRLKAYLPQYLRDQGFYKPNRAGFFLCQNPDHTDTHPSMSLNKKNNTCHCFACNATYDIFWFIQRDYELSSFKDAINKAKELFEGAEPVKQYTPKEKSYKEYINGIRKEVAFDYMNQRGINNWLANSMGFYLDKEHNSVIIPTSENSYSERFIGINKDSESGTRYKHYGKSHLFAPMPNPEHHFNEIPPIYITEGEIDAVSIMAGLNIGEGKNVDDKLDIDDIKAIPIGLGSASNIYLLINYLKEKDAPTLEKYKLVLALDNDDAGRSATTKLKDELDKLNIKYIIPDLYGNNKDANDTLLNDKNVFNNKLNNIFINYDEIYNKSLKQEELKEDINPKPQPNYEEEVNKLFKKIKDEDLHLDLNKDKLIELGIITKEFGILKYKELYFSLVEALKHPINKTVNDMKDVNVSQSKKYINNKAYEKNTPLVLRNLPIFVCWKMTYDETTNRYVKMPINPKTGKRAMVNEEERCYPPVYDENKQIVFDIVKDSNGKEHRKIRRDFNGYFNIKRLSDDACSWTDFKTACEAVDKYGCDGIGINAVKHLNLFLADLDHVKNEDGSLNDMAKEFMNNIQTYTEYSPSGDGIHMIGYANVDENRAIKKDNVELYTAKHFITLTGNIVDNIPVKVCSKQNATSIINELIKKYLSTENPSEKKYFYQVDGKYKFEPETNKNGLSNEEIINRASAMYEAKKKDYNNMNIFDELYYNGNWELFFKSQSDADLFLVGRLAFFSTSKSQVDELFRQSALMRDKWDNKSVGSGFPYGMNTINTCFKNQKYHYSVKVKE